jgi:hypothetical protein
MEQVRYSGCGVADTEGCCGSVVGDQNKQAGGNSSWVGKRALKNLPRGRSEIVC